VATSIEVHSDAP